MKNKGTCPNYLLIYLVWAFFFCPIFVTLAQSASPIKEILQLKISDSEKIKRIDSLLPLLKARNADSLEYTYHDYSFWLYDAKELNKCILYDELALEIAARRTSLDTSLLQHCAISLGFYYSKKQNLQKSVEAYKKVIEFKNTGKYAFRAYGKLGYSALKAQDFIEAVKYLELSAAFQKNDPKARTSLIYTYNNLSYALLKLETVEDLSKGIKFGLKADSLAQLIDIPYELQYLIKLNLAQLHNREIAFDFQNGKKYYESALDLAIKKKDSQKIKDVYYGLGTLYSKTDQPTSLEFYERSLALTKPKDSLSFYLNSIGKGLGFAYAKNYELAHQNTLEGINKLTKIDFSQPENITNQFLIDSPHKSNLLYVLPQLAEIQLAWYESTSDTTKLNQSLAYFELGDKVIDLLKLQSSQFQSKLFWRKISADLYGKAIRACYLKNDIPKAFYYMEKNKALLLMEDIAKEKFNRDKNLSPQIKEREERLKKEIVTIKLQLQENLTNEVKNRLSKMLIDAELKLKTIEDSLGYINSLDRINPKILTLQETQNMLNSDEVVLEYHISIDDGFGAYTNRDRIYLIAISNNNVELLELKNSKAVKTTFFDLQSTITKAWTSAEDQKLFRHLSHDLYNLLIPSQTLRETIKRKKLIIVPDNYLSFLPFEVLVTHSSKLQYLIESNSISYRYSNSFEASRTFQQPQSIEYVGFAPVEFPNQTGYYKLNHSKAEVEQIQNYFSGNIFIENNAIKETFLEQLGKAEIIHLATHANAEEGKQPWIAFYDGSISLQELYLTKNNASLVVLSGCKTTLGTNHTGEGIMSLARGFFYAGADSVLSSLWNIDDKSTTYIIGQFYSNLEKGLTKSEAIRLAKIDYLQNHSASEISPYYWASMVLIGNDGFLEPANNNLLYLLLGLFVMLVLGSTYIFSKRKGKKKVVL